MVCFVWFMSSKVGCFGNIPLSSGLFAQIKLVFWWSCLFLDLGSVMADTAGSGFVAEVREQSLYLDCFHLRREGDNHTHCQNRRIKTCLGVCSRDNTCEFYIFLQDEDWRAIDWARCANERTKESKSRSRERAQMDEDTVSLELDDDDDDFFDQQSTKRICKEARKDRSGSWKGTTIPIAKTVELRLVCVFVLMTTLVSFAYLCRTRIGGP